MQPSISNLSRSVFSQLERDLNAHAFGIIACVTLAAI